MVLCGRYGADGNYQIELLSWRINGHSSTYSSEFETTIYRVRLRQLVWSLGLLAYDQIRSNPPTVEGGFFVALLHSEKNNNHKEHKPLLYIWYCSNS